MRKFGLLGGKLEHSYSPLIHSFLGVYEYKLYEKQPEELYAFVNDSNLDGFNVTIPYKKDLFKYCRILTSVAERTGSVNTVIRKPDNLLMGENTDYYGFMYMVKRSGIEVEGKKVLLLGDGGSAATIKVVIEDLKARCLVTVSRKGPQDYNNISNHYDSDIIINSTPVGMYPNNGEAVIDITNFKKCIALFDLIYNPAQTKLVYEARQQGIKAYNGLSMLVAQAKRAAELFTDSYIDDSVIETIIQEVSKKSMNIVIIGMPGSGKSTVGKSLAKLTDRCFIDTDEEITKTYHKNTADILLDEKEEFFRNIETGILEIVTKKSNCVISTGGGVVTRERNRYLLRQNSIVIFLERDLSLLSTWNRPLSQQHTLESLYDSRIGNYIGWSDYQVKCDDISETHLKIKEVLKL
ncbi:MAG TPA: shikimate kinase [Clostridia bacterium]|nr:MAG: Shikimate dehydrogenase [Firmicutes bacterium ADurb.Bin146]HOD93490.1 shikimate kinase [Clostridia bacterium]HQM39790.1 shikimate kinase [Clostridia bacterium]